jgi:hypothetical protein
MVICVGKENFFVPLHDFLKDTAIFLSRGKRK